MIILTRTIKIELSKAYKGVHLSANGRWFQHPNAILYDSIMTVMTQCYGLGKRQSDLLARHHTAQSTTTICNEHGSKVCEDNTLTLKPQVCNQLTINQ